MRHVENWPPSIYNTFAMSSLPITLLVPAEKEAPMIKLSQVHCVKSGDCGRGALWQGLGCRLLLDDSLPRDPV